MASRVKENVALVSLEYMLPGGNRWTTVPVDCTGTGILHGTRNQEGIYVLPEHVTPGVNMVLMFSPQLTRLQPGDEIGRITPEAPPAPKRKAEKTHAHTAEE
jgi:hypothetical protein